METRSEMISLWEMNKNVKKTCFKPNIFILEISSNIDRLIKFNPNENLYCVPLFFFGEEEEEEEEKMLL
jgi:hypothetical protein